MKTTYHHRYPRRRMRVNLHIRYLATAGVALGLLFAGIVAYTIVGWPQVHLSTASAAPLTTGADLGAFAYDGMVRPTSSQEHAIASNRAPSAPSNLIATPCSDSEINLTWQRNGDNETGIVIQRSTDEVNWNTVYTASAGSNIWTDTSLYPSTAYHYRIASVNKIGSSGYTRPVVALTLPGASGGLQLPTNLTATATSATTATISFTDPNTNQSNRDYVVERSDDGGVTYQAVGTCGYDQSGPYDDAQLTPGKTYYYRLRGISNAVASSAYCDPASVTMPANPAGTPNEPTGTIVVNNNSTTNTITWTDTNHGAAGYIVERSPWGYTQKQFRFVQVGQAAAGATSFVDTSCSAESTYAYEVKAINSNGSSGYDQQTYITTASVGTGTPKVYDIGPGQTYPTIGSFNWRELGPGDTVNIHGNGSIPYHELLLLTVRGTAAAPITIQGVPDANGHYPILDGTNAVQNRQFAYDYSVFGSIGAITTYRPMGGSGAYRPGYLIIKNLEVRNCYQGDSGGNTWTDYLGNKRTYSMGAKGIYLLTGDNITIENCNIHGNGEGVFGAGQSGYERYMGNIVLRGNYIWGNGNLNSYSQHDTYIESIGALYEYNHYGPLRAGSSGGSLKDRSVDTVIRYNYVEASARVLDLVEAQNEMDKALTLPAYHSTYVYGNVLALDDPRCANIIHYGGDMGAPPLYRKGILYLWNNTIISTLSQHNQWHSTVVQLSTPGESVDARDNIIAFRSLAGGSAPELDLLPTYGNAYFGVNWVSTGWHTCFSANRFTGAVAGTQNIITGSDPGFVSWEKQNYHLVAGSPCIGRSGPLPAAVAHFPLLYQYRAPQTAFGTPGRAPRRDGMIHAAMRAKAFHKSASGMPDLGVGASLNGKQVFPADNPWNQRVDNLPVDPNSDALIREIGADQSLHPDFGANWEGHPFGIPYMVVPGTTQLEPITFDYADQSDPGPYPVPPSAPVEDVNDPGGDHHVIVIDRDHWKLYELFGANWTGNGWHAGSGAVYDLHSDAERPAGWTSADAAGLPIFPGLVRYDEVVGQGEIDHALRFTVRRSRRAYVDPARHFASHSNDPSLPPMGMRVRLKASVDISGYPPQARVILQALKTYGMILADNGGNWFVSGAPDSRWNDSELAALKQLHGSDFEVVKMGPETTN